MRRLYEKYKDVIPYLFFGVCTTLVNIAVYWFSTAVIGLKVMPGTIIAWFAAVIFAYITNRKWVFHSEAKGFKEIAVETLKFFGFRLATGVLDWLIMYIFADYLHWNDVIVKIVANIVVIIANYIASKLVIFKKKKVTDVNNVEEVKERSVLQIIFAVGVVVLFIIAWISFIITPFTGDIKVFMASAHQSSYISNSIIIGSFKAWELKSVFSRELAYIIYKIALLFTSYSTYSFEIVCKAIYSIILILVSLVSMRLIFNNNWMKVIQGTVVVSLLFMSMHTGCQMQVEMTCSLLVLLSFALYINSIKTEKKVFLKLLCSGMLIGATFFFKSVLILLSVTVVAAVCIYKKENNKQLSIKRLLIVVLGSIITLAITSALILIINPLEFQDMLDASAFQSTLLSYAFSIKDIIVKFLKQHWLSIRFLVLALYQ